MSAVNRAVRRLEPLFWMLFGAGAMAAAMILPALFAALAIAIPLGWFGTPEESFLRLRLLIDNPIGKLALGLVLSLVFWHSAHHVRHFAYDVGLGSPHGTAVPLAAYGCALLATLAAVGVLAGL
jgi:fumarate reductase subunit D